MHKKETTKRTVMQANNYTVVDEETGEIIAKNNDDSRIIFEEKNEQEEDNLIHNFNSNIPFVKLYLEVNKLRNYLTQQEFVIAISLADYICYEDCILRKGGHNNGAILTAKDLAKEMDMKYDTLQKKLTSLNKKGIIAFYKVGCKDNPNLLTKAIIVNPNVYTKGCNINKTLLGMFENSNW